MLNLERTYQRIGLGDVDPIQPLDISQPMFRGVKGLWLPLPHLGGGTTLYDLSGRGRHGALTNMDPDSDWVHKGDRSNPVLAFDGTDDHINLDAYADDLSGVTYSIAMWVRPASIGVTTSLFDGWVGGGNAHRNFVIQLTSSGTINAGHRDTSFTWHTPETTESLVAGNKYFVVLTYDGADIRVYLNGTERASEATTADPITDISVVRIANDPYDGTFYTGDVSGAIFYNRGITGTEVKALYQIQQRGYSDLLNRQRTMVPLGLVGPVDVTTSLTTAQAVGYDPTIFAPGGSLDRPDVAVSKALPTHGLSLLGVGNIPLTSNRPEVAIPTESDWSSTTSILTPGSVGSWDERLAGPSPASVVKTGGTYYLYYVGAAGDRGDGGPANRGVGLATSTDGDMWTKHGSNPVIPWSDLQNNNDAEEGAWGVAAYVDGSEIILYVTDLVGSGGTVAGDIRLFTSTDGVNFTDQGIVIDNSNANFPGNDENTPIGVYPDDGGTWHMYYLAKGTDVTDYSLVHATGTARDSWDLGTVIRTVDHRFGGDVVVLRDDDDGVKIGIMVTTKRGTPEETDYLSVSDADFGAETLEQSYGWGTAASAHYLDRGANEWFAFHSDCFCDDVTNIQMRTAPVNTI